MVNEIKGKQMKERISKLLKQHAELETNLSSEAGRELLTNEILDILNPNTRTDEWRIEQFNRNRAVEDQVSTIEEMEASMNKLFIYESPNGGNTVYRRVSGDYDNKELIQD